LVAVLCLFVVAGPFARVFTHNELWADYGYLSCMDGIALGCLAALAVPWLVDRPRVLLAMRIGGIVLMVLVLAAKPVVRWLHFYQSGLDFTALAMGTALLLIPITVAGREGSWVSAPLRWMGRNSYEIYLTHMFVVMFGVQFFLARKWSVSRAPIYSVGLLVLCVVLGAVVAKWYSEPLNRRLRRSSVSTERALKQSA
jgi:peptidoglycan/LPS O-acetylase OafA/YrhL